MNKAVCGITSMQTGSGRNVPNGKISGSRACAREPLNKSSAENKDENGEKYMNTEKPKEATKAQDEKAPNEAAVERLLQERINQWSQPFICPFCGKTECKSFWHLLKLSTLPRSYLRPKHYFQIYGLLFIAVVLLLATYIGFLILSGNTK